MFVVQINIYSRDGVFTARYGMNLYVVQINIYNRDGECLLRGISCSNCPPKCVEGPV